MTLARRLSIVQQDDAEILGDDCADIQAIDVDPNAVSDLAFRLKVSRDLFAQAKQIEQQRRTLNKILLRFQLDGRPIPLEDSDVA